MNFILVDDSETFLEGLLYLVEKNPENKVIAKVRNGKELLELDNLHYADFVLMDINLPGLNGIDAAKKSLWHNPLMNILAVTMYTGAAYLKELLEAGFKGCVFKSEIYTDLEKAIESIKRGQYYFPVKIIISADEAGSLQSPTE